jgi:hypothetical protein
MKLLPAVSLTLALVAGLRAAPVATGQFDRTLTVTGEVDLDAITSSGGIVVTGGGPAGTVHVHGDLQANDHNAEARIAEMESNPPIEQSGNALRIGYGRGFRLEGISVRLEIEVPPNTRVRARSSSGGIRVSRVTGAVVARASSGGVYVADAGSSIDAETSSGGIRLSQVAAAPIHAHAASGSVNILLAPGAGYDLDIATASGRVATPEMTVRNGFSRRDFSRHHAEGEVRGGGPQVSVRASSGSVRVD